MTPLFKKLNYKTPAAIVVANAPASFEAELAPMRSIATVVDGLGKAKQVEFVIVFTTKQAEVDKAADSIAKKVTDDAVVWFCYPKGSSKNYTCEFNRDTGWNRLGELGFEPVRMVAVDADWSALRFRKVEHIKTMTRSFAMTKKGKEKVAKQK